LLLIKRERLLPPRRIRGRLIIVAGGVVVGWPLFTAFALQQLGAAYSAVIVGLLPAATAVAAVARAGERPSLRFWLAAAAGLAAALTFAATQGASGIGLADLFVLLAVACAALGYAEGGALAREFGGWRVICWALVISAPVLAPVVAIPTFITGIVAGPAAWAGLAYVSLISMFLGFFAWYRGLASGGVARIGQLQLAQPLLTLAWAAIFLGEAIGIWTLIAAVAVLASVAATQRTGPTRPIRVAGSSDSGLPSPPPGYQPGYPPPPGAPDAPGPAPPEAGPARPDSRPPQGGSSPPGS
ncbi:MAG: DMT family transporter, partial [Geminicoccaceae bacterium]